MKTRHDFEKARQAYEHAWSEARRWGDEAGEALRMRDLVVLESLKRNFKSKAQRALEASEKWQLAAKVAMNVIGEIASGPALGQGEE